MEERGREEEGKRKVKNVKEGNEVTVWAAGKRGRQEGKLELAGCRASRRRRGRQRCA